MRWLAPLCLLAALAAACGTDESSGSGSDAPDTSLTISYRADADAATQVSTLECDPMGGTLENAENACRQLSQVAEPFQPLQPDQACTEIYGGPQTATVRGTFRGGEVDASFARTNGCEIEQWDEYAFLFPDSA